LAEATEGTREPLSLKSLLIKVDRKDVDELHLQPYMRLQMASEEFIALKTARVGSYSILGSMSERHL